MKRWLILRARTAERGAVTEPYYEMGVEMNEWAMQHFNDDMPFKMLKECGKIS
jgi:hypothetical protein